MKYLIIAAIMALLLTAGIVVALNATTSGDIPSTEAKTTAVSGCSGCGNGCTAEKNCGLATCGAVSGKTCGCNKG